MLDRILRQYTYSHVSQEGKYPVFLGCQITYANFSKVLAAIKEFVEEIHTEDDESVLITNRGMEQKMYVHVGQYIFLDEDMRVFTIPAYLKPFLFVEVENPK